MFTLIFIISLLSFSIGMSFILGGWFIPLWIVTGWFVGYFVVILFIIFFTYVTLPLPITSKFKNYIWRSASWIVNRLVFNLWLSVEGLERIPMDGKLVIYSNHKSYLDPVILMQIIKRPFAFTPKSSLFKIPILKDIMKSMGCMPIYRGDDRKTAKGMVKTIKDIENGLAVAIFPEGGRKDRDTDQMIQARAGAYKLAVKPKATILPVTINGNSVIRKRAPFRPTKIKIIVHDPITYETYKDLTTTDIADLVLHRINSGVINKKEEVIE